MKAFTFDGKELNKARFGGGGKTDITFFEMVGMAKRSFEITLSSKWGLTVFTLLLVVMIVLFVAVYLFIDNYDDDKVIDEAIVLLEKVQDLERDTEINEDEFIPPLDEILGFKFKKDQIFRSL